MSVRRATAADVDALLALWSVARTPHAVTADSAEAIRLALDRCAIFVADAPAPTGAAGAALAGAIVAGWDGWRGNLYRLAVLPDHRRTGLASALVVAAEAWLVGEGAARISVLVAFEDSGARRFWRAVGYDADAVIGRMVRDLESTT